MLHFFVFVIIRSVSGDGPLEGEVMEVATGCKKSSFEGSRRAEPHTWGNQASAELKGPRKPLRIRPEIFAFEPDLGLKLGQDKPQISGTVPTNRHTTIPSDSRPASACFDDDPKIVKL